MVMRRVAFFFCLFQALLVLELRAKSLWQTWVARYDVEQVIEADSHLFILANGALHSLNKVDYSIRLYDRSNGLSDVGISHIAWASEIKKLLIVYRSGMIDLLSSEDIEHIPALREAAHIPKKDIYAISIQGHRAWLSGACGIMQIDLARALVEGTYLVNSAIQFAAKTDGGQLIALLSGQIYEGRLSDNLQDPSAWRDRSELGDGWEQVFSSHGELIGLRRGQAVKIVNNEVQPIGDIGSVRQIHVLSDGVVLQTSDRLYHLVRDEMQLLSSVSARSLTGTLGRGIWLAKGEAGLTLLRMKGDNWHESPIPDVQDAPRGNNMYAMRYHGGRLYVVGGGRDKDRFRIPGIIQIFDGKRWTSLLDKDIQAQTGKLFLDPVDIIPHRDGKPHHYYVATWGEGLYELEDGRVLARYDVDNSALVSAVPGSEGYTRVGSLCYDAQGNLWMAQGLTKDSGGGSVVRLSPSGQWQAFDYQPIKASNSFHTHIALPDGTKWLLDNHLADHGEGVFVYNDRGTDDLSDDVYAHYTSLRESSGKLITFSKVTAMAVDKKGSLWLGANIGFFYVQRPDELPRHDRAPIAVRPVATNDEGSSYYVLDNVTVSTIAVDALNRKWMGTAATGLYLLSEDGMTVLRHYTTENSPLLSNHILSLAVDEVGGRLFIGTPMGLNVLDTRTAREHISEQVKLVAYPNPLRPEYPNVITVEGLPAGSVIEVSDASGRLVHRDQTVDYAYEWPTYGRDGRRLPSGVYTIVVHSQEQKKLGQIKVSIVSND